MGIWPVVPQNMFTPVHLFQARWRPWKGGSDARASLCSLSACAHSDSDSPDWPRFTPALEQTDHHEDVNVLAVEYDKWVICTLAGEIEGMFPCPMLLCILTHPGYPTRG
jgi:hypothetical protein